MPTGLSPGTVEEGQSKPYPWLMEVAVSQLHIRRCLERLPIKSSKFIVEVLPCEFGNAQQLTSLVLFMVTETLSRGRKKVHPPKM